MAAIRLQDISIQRGSRLVLDRLTLDLHPNETVGLIGANGAGKTTLFRIISGQLKPDSGTATSARSLRIGQLEQEPRFDPANTLHDEVLSTFDQLFAIEKRMHDVSEEMSRCTDDGRLAELMAEYDKINARFVAAGGYTIEQRLNEIVAGVGFRPADLKLPMTALSGGQRCRAALARLLLEENTFLLLDEPTNHLDIDAVRWLERYLAGHRGGAMIVSHDRYLLDRLATRIVELEGGRVRSYPGNYSNYVKARDVRRLTEERQFEQDMAFLAKERAFINKHLAGQRTAEAKGRRKRLERRLESGEFTTERPRDRQSIGLQFDAGTLGKGDLMVGRELSKSYGDKPLFSELDVEVRAGERVGITGPNGTGKSTLLKILLNTVEQDRGEVELAPKTDVGYFAQDASALDLEQSILTEVAAAAPAMSETQIRGMLGRFLFSGDDVHKQIGRLSGGEQSRIRLIKLILQQPNVLVLDEPTNHLDIPSREALEEALLAYPGSILMVSHDRYFLDRLAQRLLVIRPDAHEWVVGNYSTYIDRLEARRSENDKQRATKPRRLDKKKPSPARAPASPFAKLSFEQLEAEIMQREEQLGEIERDFANPDLARDPEALARKKAAFDAAKAELAELSALWEQRVEDVTPES